MIEYSNPFKVLGFRGFGLGGILLKYVVCWVLGVEIWTYACLKFNWGRVGRKSGAGG